MIKYFKGDVDNSVQDMIAMQYGSAYTLYKDGKASIATTRAEVDKLKREGWKHKWTIHSSDFQH